MDESQFDAIARTLGSRRTALAGLVGGVAAVLGLAVSEEAEAHNFVARCRRLRDPVQRHFCLKRARQHNRRHKYCLRIAPLLACGDRGCGFAEACGRLVSCGKPDGSCEATGYTCLPGNGGCAFACTIPGRACAAPNDFCECAKEAETEETYCVLPETSCNHLTVCTTNSDCAASEMCGLIQCPGGSEERRCRALCG